MNEYKTIGSLITTLLSTLGGLLLITGQCETTEQLVFSFLLMTVFSLITLLILKSK